MELGFEVGKIPSSYLGLLLGKPIRSTTVWDAVEERFHRR